MKMAALEKHLAQLQLKSHNNLTLVFDNAGGTSLADPRLNACLSSFHSSITPQSSPTMDSWRNSVEKYSKNQGRRNTNLASFSKPRTDRWQSEEKNVFEMSPSCPRRSPDGKMGRRPLSISTRNLLMSLPYETEPDGVTSRNPRGGKVGMGLPSLDDSSDAFGDSLRDFDAWKC
jgi:hypothetical protein